MAKEKWDYYKEYAALAMQWQNHVLNVRKQLIAEKFQMVELQSNINDIRIKQRTRRAYNQAMRGLAREKQQLRKRAKQLNSMSNKCRNVRVVDSLDPNEVTLMWQGFRYFLRVLPIELVNEIASGFISSSSRDDYRGIANREVDWQDIPTLPLAWCDWLMDSRVLPRQGHDHHIELINVFDKIASYGEVKVAELKESFKKSRDETYDYWKPVELI